MILAALQNLLDCLDPATLPYQQWRLTFCMETTFSRSSSNPQASRRPQNHPSHLPVHSPVLSHDLEPARGRPSSPLVLCQHRNVTYTVFFHRHGGEEGQRWPFCFTPQETKRIRLEHMVLMILERGNLSTPSSFLDVSEIARFSLFPFTPVVFFS